MDPAKTIGMSIGCFLIAACQTPAPSAGNDYYYLGLISGDADGFWFNLETGGVAVGDVVGAGNARCSKPGLALCWLGQYPLLAPEILECTQKVYLIDGGQFFCSRKFGSSGNEVFHFVFSREKKYYQYWYSEDREVLGISAAYGGAMNENPNFGDIYASGFCYDTCIKF